MHVGKLVFSQVIDHVPMHTFRRCVARYGGNRYKKSFSCLDQYLCMAFAQLTYRESLRDIEACLRAQKDKLYHMGIRGNVSRSTLADANQRQDWRIYADLAQALIRIARPLYADEDLGLDLDNTVYALDASTIDLCLSVFPWALFRSTKSAVNLHTLLDLRGNIPTFIHISDGKLHDVNVLDILLPESGAFYLMDRGYVDFQRLFTLHMAGSFFIIRAKSDTKYRRRYSHPADKSGGVRCDQTIVLMGVKSKRDYPQPLRRIKYHDAQTGKTFNFLTNNFAIPAQTVADLYRYRWQVEDWHRVLKSGCRIEGLAHQTAERLKRAIAINLVIAWRIMLMTLMGRACPELPAEVLFSDLEVNVLSAYAAKKLHPPTRLADAVHLVAIIGGYLARRKDPPPGHQLMWLGYSYLQRMCEGYLLRDEFAGSG